MATKAAFFWNNQPAEGGGNFTLQAGITPSTAVLRLPMSAQISQIGTLRLANLANGQALTFQRCRVVRLNIADGGGAGKWQEITIEDRRWMWGEGYSSVFGEFNRINPPRGLQVNQLSAYLLAVRLMNALGEVGYSISGVPGDQFPSISWDAASPSAELEALAQQYGCMVTLSPLDRAVVFKNGQGVSFNAQDPRLMDTNYTFQPQIVPGQLVLDGGVMHIHHDLPLRAVAPRSNYSDDFIPIDSLSYVPTGGWEATGGNMNTVDPAFRKLAQDNVFKVYEVCQGFAKAPTQDKAKSIKFPIPPSIDFSSGGDTKKESDLRKLLTVDNESIHRILPLNETRYNFGSFFADTTNKVWGFWYNGGKLARNTRYDITNPTSLYTDCEGQLPAMSDSSVMPVSDPLAANFEMIVPDSYRDSLDLNNGRVKFNQPVFFRDQNNQSLEAWLRLRCSFPIRDPQTMAMLTSQYWFNPVNPIEVQITKVVKNSEIFLEYSTGGQSNLDEFVAASYAALANDISQITHAQGVSAPYQTWVFDIPIDGIVKAIAWDHAESGEATTHIDYNIERPSFYETLTERRLRRLYTYNALLDLETKRKQKRGVTQVRFGGNRP